MVTVCVLATPVVTLPKLTLPGITDISGCMPVPASEIVAEVTAKWQSYGLPGAGKPIWK